MHGATAVQRTAAADYGTAACSNAASPLLNLWDSTKALHRSGVPLQSCPPCCHCPRPKLPLKQNLSFSPTPWHAVHTTYCRGHLSESPGKQVSPHHPMNSVEASSSSLTCQHHPVALQEGQRALSPFGPSVALILSVPLPLLPLPLPRPATVSPTSTSAAAASRDVLRGACVILPAHVQPVRTWQQTYARQRCHVLALLAERNFVISTTVISTAAAMFSRIRETLQPAAQVLAACNFRRRVEQKDEGHQKQEQHGGRHEERHKAEP